MNKSDLENRQKDYVFCFYLQKFCEANKSSFPDVLLPDIFDVIFNDKKLLVEFLFFMGNKMYLLTFTKDELAKLQELFLSDFN